MSLRSFFQLSRSRIISLAAVLAFILALFVLIFQVIDQRLELLNRRILKEVGFEKYQLVQKELDELDRLLQMMSILVDEQQTALLPKFLAADTLREIVVAYKLVGDVKHTSAGQEWSLAHKSLLSQLLAQQVGKSVGELKLLSAQQQYYLLITRSTQQGNLHVLLDLEKLNQHFAAQDLGNRAYFELYDVDGLCVLHPDMTQIGRKRNPQLSQGTALKDQIILSDFIKIQVLCDAYKLKGLFSQSSLFVYVPLIMTEDELRDIANSIFLIGGVGIAVILLLLYFADSKDRHARALALRNLEHQKEDALLRLDNLKRKIDPHFLFNALGSLQQLIGKDAQLAKSFVGKMAKVYRQFLSADTSGLATLRSEIALAEEYFFMQKIRFGETLLPLDIQVSTEDLSLKIPRFSLQILVENAIKHNELSTENPLQIKIYKLGERLHVCNNAVPRKPQEDSVGYGTQFIRHIYDFYQIQGFEIQQDEQQFSLYLPLLTEDPA